jgi:hypothetical protein
MVLTNGVDDAIIILFVTVVQQIIWSVSKEHIGIMTFCDVNQNQILALTVLLHQQQQQQQRLQPQLWTVV